MKATELPQLDWPLMRNNITRDDLEAVRSFLLDEPILTHSRQVRAFEEEWSRWLGVKYSVFINSGASANLLTMAALREIGGPGQVIVPTLTWVSDIASVLQNGFEPVFVDINPRTLGMAEDQIIAAITPATRAVFLTHVLGFNALSQRLLDELARRGVPLIEDVCESYGATYAGRKLGTYGLVSNYSFYYAHHLSTVEGGMVSTNDAKIFDTVRMMRSHGMVRESGDAATKAAYAQAHPDLHPDFIFAFPAYNVRPQEINAVIGRQQLPRLDSNNERRRANFRRFLAALDPQYFVTDFAEEGSCNYAFVLVLRHPDEQRRDRLMAAMRTMQVEFRRGTAGGGNQLRQPYLRRLLGDKIDLQRFPNVDHVHFFGFYIGNYPDLEPAKIERLCTVLNEVARA